jgi:5-methylcytosine-specific restriction endonuclease McrA
MAGRSTTTSCGHAGLCGCAGASKRCSRCGAWLPKDDEHFYLKSTGYFGSQCRPCARAGALGWRSSNLERARESSWRWYRDNPERAIENRVAWRAENPERDREARDRYEAAHPLRHQERRATMTAEERAAVAAQKKAWRLRTHETTRLVEIRNAEKRRARLGEVDYEDIDRRALFERDAGLCWICEQPVDLTLEWPDPGFASVDHVVMVRDGGPHTMANVRLAHLRCNQGRPRTREEAARL